MYKLAFFIVGNLINLCQVLLLSYMLKSKYSRLFVVLSYLIPTIPLTYVKYYEVNHGLSLTGYTVLVSLVLFLHLFLVFQESTWKRLFALFLLYLISMATSICTSVISTQIFHESATDIQYTPQQLLSLLISSVFFIILSPTVVTLWYYMVNGIHYQFNFSYFLFPASQVSLLLLISYFDFTGNLVDSPLVFAAFLIGLVAVCVLFYILIKEQERKTLEQKVLELKYMRSLELLHYQEIERKIDNLAKIRHDLNNQLATAYYLAEQGEVETAKVMLKALEKKINEISNAGQS